MAGVKVFPLGVLVTAAMALPTALAVCFSSSDAELASLSSVSLLASLSLASLSLSSLGAVSGLAASSGRILSFLLGV